MAIFVICAISGTLLGLFFRVFPLVSAMLLATVVITVMGWTHGLELGMIALTVLGAMALLQIGYVVGCVLHTVPLAYWPSPTKPRNWFSRSKPALN